MPTDKDLAGFGEKLAENLIPIIKEDIAAQIDVKISASSFVIQERLAEVNAAIEESRKLAGNDADILHQRIGEDETRIRALEDSVKTQVDTLRDSTVSAIDDLQKLVTSAQDEAFTKLETAVKGTSDSITKLVDNIATTTAEALYKSNGERDEQVKSLTGQVQAVVERQDAFDEKLKNTPTEGNLAAVHSELQESHAAVAARLKAFDEVIVQYDAATKALADKLVKIDEDLAERDKRFITTITHQDVSITRAVETATEERAALSEALQVAQMEIVNLRARLDTPVDHAPLIKQMVEDQVGRMRAEITLSMMTELHKEFERLPVPQNGKDGRDGKFLDPVMYVEGKRYPYQSMVKYDGGLFYALRDTDSAPGSSDWQLVVEGIKGINVERSIDMREHSIEVERTSGAKEVFEFKTEVPLYCGIFDQAKSYDAGDIVTYDGSTWIALETPIKGDKPKESQAWKLQTKRGTDARSPAPVRSHVRGHYKEGDVYEMGDMVEYGGRVWVAKIQNRNAPPAEFMRSNFDWSMLS